jgi:hypothetical protein
MIVKALEIRDRNTFIPAAAIKMDPANAEQRYLLARVGFRDGLSVTLMRLNDQKATADPYQWGASERTMPNAHVYIEKHFDELKDGDVVDVEFILGESRAPKVSERADPYGNAA